MQCEEVPENVIEYLNGDLREPRLSRLKQHFSVCDACRTEVEELKPIWELLGMLPAAEPSPDSRARFDRMVETFKQGFEQGRSAKPMPEPETLGALEQQLLTAMLSLGLEPDASVIYDKVCNVAGKRVGQDTFYTTLYRLEEKGLLIARQSEPKNPLRGKPKRLYRIEEAGLRALKESLGDSARRLSEILEENSGSERTWISKFIRKGHQES